MRVPRNGRKPPAATHLLGKGREPLRPAMAPEGVFKGGPYGVFSAPLVPGPGPGTNGFHPWPLGRCPALPGARNGGIEIRRLTCNVRWADFLITMRCWAWNRKLHRGTLPGPSGPCCAATTPTPVLQRHRGRRQPGTACCFNGPWRPMRSWPIPSGVPAMTANTTRTRCFPQVLSHRLPRSFGPPPRVRGPVARSP